MNGFLWTFSILFRFLNLCFSWRLALLWCCACLGAHFWHSQIGRVKKKSTSTIVWALEVFVLIFLQSMKCWEFPKGQCWLFTVAHFNYTNMLQKHVILVWNGNTKQIKMYPFLSSPANTKAISGILLKDYFTQKNTSSKTVTLFLWNRKGAMLKNCTYNEMALRLQQMTKKHYTTTINVLHAIHALFSKSSETIQ